MERVLASSGVERTPAARRDSYLGELSRAARKALMEALMKAGEALHLSPRVLWAAVALFAALVFLLIARAVFSQLRRRRAVGEEKEMSPPAPRPPRQPFPATPPAGAPSWSAGWLRGGRRRPGSPLVVARALAGRA